MWTSWEGWSTSGPTAGEKLAWASPVSGDQQIWPGTVLSLPYILIASSEWGSEGTSV